MEEEKLQIVPYIEENWSFAEIAEKRTPVTWERVFTECLSTFRHIDKILGNKNLYPLRRHTFRAFDITPVNKVKVILLGQDPYPSLVSPGKPKAVGLSFSIDYFDPEIPVSLRNIFAEIKRSYPETVFNSGSLIPWCKQGVLLINTALTFCPEDEKPHVDLWKHFIITVLQEVATVNEKCVAILLGSHAQSYHRYMKSNIEVLETSHPSGRSAHMGFTGSEIFRKCNESLVNFGLTPIDWNIR